MAPDKPLDSAVLSRLKQFSAMNKLKKMALRVSLLVSQPKLKMEFVSLEPVFVLLLLSGHC